MAFSFAAGTGCSATSARPSQSPSAHVPSAVPMHRDRTASIVMAVAIACVITTVDAQVATSTVVTRHAARAAAPTARTSGEIGVTNIAASAATTYVTSHAVTDRGARMPPPATHGPPRQDRPHLARPREISPELRLLRSLLAMLRRAATSRLAASRSAASEVTASAAAAPDVVVADGAAITTAARRMARRDGPALCRA